MEWRIDAGCRSVRSAIGTSRRQRGYSRHSGRESYGSVGEPGRLAGAPRRFRGASWVVRRSPFTGFVTRLHGVYGVCQFNSGTISCLDYTVTWVNEETESGGLTFGKRGVPE